MVKETSVADADPAYYHILSNEMRKNAELAPVGSFERLALASFAGLAIGIAEILEQLQEEGDDDGE